MKWTTERPMKPGDYWVSIAPEKRPAEQRPDVVFPAVVPFILYGGGQGSYREGGSMLDLSDPWFDGAQWSPRETPADPFATAESKPTPEEENTGEPCDACGARQPRIALRWTEGREEFIVRLSFRVQRAEAKKEIAGLCSLLKVCAS